MFDRSKVKENFDAMLTVSRGSALHGEKYLLTMEMGVNGQIQHS
jgi:hypothetical protein